MMVPLKNIDSLSYRQLQTAAKRSNVPANLKRNYLIKLIVARSQGNESLIRTIIQEAHQERVSSKNHQGGKVSRIEDVCKIIGKNSQLKKPKTELEKLLKAPMSSTPNHLRVNYRNDQIANNHNFKFNNHNNRRTSASKNISEKQRNDSTGGWSKGTVDGYQNYERCEILSTDDEDQSELNTMQNINHEMRMVNPKSHTSDRSSNSEYINVESWNNHESSVNDVYFSQAEVEDSTCKSLVPTSSSDFHQFKENDIRTEVRNMVTIDEFNRSFSRDHLYTRSQRQQHMSSSEITKFNSHKSYYKPEGMYKKENYIVINQHFQFYRSNYPDNSMMVQESSYFNQYPENGNIRNMDYQSFGYESRLPILEKSSKKYYINNNTYSENVKDFEQLPIAEAQNVNKRVYSQYTSKTTNNTNEYLKEIEVYNQKSSEHDYIKSNTALTKLIPITYTSNNQDKGESTHTPIITNRNKDMFREFMSLDLRYDTNEDVSSVLEDYFDDSGNPKKRDKSTIVRNMPIIGQIEEVYTTQNDKETQIENNWNSAPYSTLPKIATSVLCFLCNWLGKVSDFETHVKKKHFDSIFKMTDGMITLTLNMGILSKNKKNNHHTVFIEHCRNLYIVHFKYKYPDIVSSIILSVPPNGQCVIESPLLATSKYYLQVINLNKKEEQLWSGQIDCMNMPDRQLDEDVFKDRKSDNIEFSMRSLDLVPKNIAMKDIPKYLLNCVVEVHIFIETLEDLQIGNET